MDSFEKDALRAQIRQAKRALTPAQIASASAELAAALRGEYAVDEAFRLIQQRSRNYAKRQLTWFRRERDVRWLDKSLVSSDEEILKEILNTIDKEWSLQK